MPHARLFQGENYKNSIFRFFRGFWIFLGWGEEERVRSWFVIFSTIIN